MSCLGLDHRVRLSNFRIRAQTLGDSGGVIILHEQVASSTVQYATVERILDGNEPPSQGESLIANRWRLYWTQYRSGQGQPTRQDCLLQGGRLICRKLCVSGPRAFPCGVQ